MLGCGALQYIHYQEVAVQCCVSRCEDRCDLMLSRSYLVVLGLNSDTQFPELLIHICHEICNLGLQRSEVLVLHLPVLSVPVLRKEYVQHRSGPDAPDIFHDLQ